MTLHFGKSGIPMLYGGEPEALNLSPLRKIRDIKPCLDPAHNPPSHLYLEGGEYEWTCPSCGKKVEFVVPSITFASHAYNGVMPKQTLTA